MIVRQSNGQGYVFYPSTVWVDPSEQEIKRLFDDLEEVIRLPDAWKDVTVDFTYCEFLNHTAVACLGGLARLVESRGGRMRFSWETLSKAIYTNLAQNGFIFDFDRSRSPWDGNSVPYWSAIRHEPQAVVEYLRDRWLGKGWVNVSDGLRNGIAGQVSELYLNAFDHSQSQIGVVSCGQYYETTGLLQLTIADFGVGIPGTVCGLPQNHGLSTCEALRWAFTLGNSSRQGICSGMGLSLTEEFVAKNHGKLSLYTHDGRVTVDHNGTRY